MIDVYQMITDKMVEQLEKGIVPWQKPWTEISGGAISHTNGKSYSLLNQFLLENIAGEWLTFNQIKAEGGSIKSGEKAHFVTFWKFIPKYAIDENGHKTEEVIGQYPILKYYNVWHISQCEGIKEKYPHELTELVPIEKCEGVVTNYLTREGIHAMRDVESNRAFYRPTNDSIVVPNINQFSIVEEYYSTLFHEITHSTGAEVRLNREGIANFDFFGSEQYSKEELIAEMGAAFLCSYFGLDASKAFKNSAAYIGSWLKKIKGDKKLVVAAAAKAEQAVEFILNGIKPNTK